MVPVVDTVDAVADVDGMVVLPSQPLRSFVVDSVPYTTMCVMVYEIVSMVPIVVQNWIPMAPDYRYS